MVESNQDASKTNGNDKPRRKKLATSGKKLARSEATRRLLAAIIWQMTVALRRVNAPQGECHRGRTPTTEESSTATPYTAPETNPRDPGQYRRSQNDIPVPDFTSISRTTHTTSDYRIATKWLEDRHYTFHFKILDDEKCLRVVVRGLDRCITIPEIQEDLENKGFEMSKLARLRNSRTKEELPLIQEIGGEGFDDFGEHDIEELLVDEALNDDDILESMVDATKDFETVDSELEDVTPLDEKLLREGLQLSGRTWIRHLKINLEEIDQENLNQIKELKVSSINDDYDIEKEFPEIYTQKVGCVPDFLITLQLRQGAKPSFTPERNVPYALREKVEKIFHPKSKFPKMTSAHLLRYASFIAGFDYVVSFKKGTENQIADCLSRAPTAQGYVTTDMIINEEVHRICSSTVFEISTKTLTVEEIVKETDKDKELSKLKRDIKSNSIESDYTINGEILFKNDKVVVPKSLQLEVLKDLHSTHLGIVKMKQLARRYCTWKNIDKDIENLVKSCKDCLSTQNNPPKAPVHHWDPPSTNWERIHLDYAGPFQGYYYLVLIDAKSRWAEIKAISEPPTSLNTIKLLNDIFSTHGYPFVMVSDNASIFTGDIFSNYCLENGIRQKFIAPGHPATNGLAERNVQTLKNKLKSMINENVPIHQKIQKILLRYRATPLASGRSPSEMYLNRQIRIKLDAMRPYQEEKSQQQIQPRTRCLQVGERVQARVFISNKPFWKNGTIKQKLGNLHYIIELDEGKSPKRHINQLQKVEIKKKQVTFDESTIHHQSKPSQSSPDFDPIQYTVSQPEPNQQEHHDPDQTSDQDPTSMPDTPLRRSQRPRRPPRHLEDYVYTTRNIKQETIPKCLI
ncbi:K02A2.6-like [Cordylochernes scorpioides]|uniref:RNA-directed DNA polymerase n=1 Tax=Cordylochernes scorpioides TaxID=51811 RepID=A0ABY6K130_9ARAC|nr:K02A2.6-like [Cordylochernes scorpioides]